MTESSIPPGARDFDFLIGEWRIHNRRLTERLVGADTWETFDATLSVRSILGGLGNVDEFKADWNGKRVEALTLRIFNPHTEEWSLYWVDNLTAVVQPAVVGRFRDGRGEFFARDFHKGIPVLVRFIWKDITGNSATWEQAFSMDEGQTWETNWTMEFTRAGDETRQSHGTGSEGRRT
ncbi:MAG: DUF1579 domain-containing protein [Ignavibacteria bacterium]|nr:DUF1579 domain-containing protein [Ignavibacteria bacterium]